MSVIGYLRPKSDDVYGELIGSIRTLSLDLRIRLVLDGGEADSNFPSHKIVARASGGEDVAIGAAWLKTIQRGERIGDRFLSMSIDDPSLPHALHVAAFRKNDTAQWEIVWRRKEDAA